MLVLLLLNHLLTHDSSVSKPRLLTLEHEIRHPYNYDLMSYGGGVLWYRDDSAHGDIQPSDASIGISSIRSVMLLLH